MNFRIAAWGVPAILVVASVQPLLAQQELTDKERAELTLKLAKAKVGELAIHLGDDRTKQLKRHPTSVLRWSNPVSTALYGEVFIWTAAGRPEVIVSTHKFFQSNRKHMTGEFHSLALGPLSATQNNKPFWATQEPGITLKSIPGAATPAKTAAQRLAQMRSFARRFSAEASARNEPEKRERLRLLSKQLYRYESTNPAVIDGAIFAFAQGTNPEVLLVLEARLADSAPEWRYALVRFNSVEMRAFYNGQLVWSAPQVAPPWDDVRDARKPYFVPVLDRGEEQP